LQQSGTSRFWGNFNSDLLVKNVSDQGPLGGRRAIYWRSGTSVYKFKTGWVTIEPGTDNSIEENGFVLINNDRTEMAVYYLWDE
jgi:hypothetical protein